MDRIFTSLASCTILLMLIALGLGLALHAAGPRDVMSESASSWYRSHFMVGVGVGLAVVLVNSLVMTWFIGTSRWCKEVADTYSLDRDIVASSNRIKRGAFPYALAHMLIIVGVLSLGAAADPSGNLKVAPPGGLSWAQWHLISAVGAVLAIAAGSVVEWRALRENQQLIQRVKAEADAKRRAKGLAA
ncbi:MAG TPA: hypothetical protein VFI31_29865 [Pirellulales bacterium]|nr:hypothetical protein [Pirellulales bacterium]